MLDTDSPHIYAGRVGYWGELAVGRIDFGEDYAHLSAKLIKNKINTKITS